MYFPNFLAPIRNLLSSNKGFSIIEITIILIILGVLISGSSAGFYLVQRSKLQNIVTEFANIKQSVNAFNMTYHGLPGDLIDVKDRFSAAIVSTCGHGNGNGLIEDEKTTDTSSNAATDVFENTCAWAYLEDAQTLSGHLSQKYPGTFKGAGPLTLKGDIPESKFSGSGFFFGARQGYNVVEFGTVVGSTTVPGGALTSKQASSIVTKTASYNTPSTLDTSGSIMAMNSITISSGSITEGTDCVASDGSFENLLDETKVGCMLSSIIRVN